MEAIKIFNNPTFGDVRITEVNDDPVFCLADVCKALDIKNVSDCKSRLNPKGVVITDTLTNGGYQQMSFISESNLYKCIFQSRRPDAEKFQDWVFDEVLPSIRKHGAYMTERTLEQALLNPDYLIQLATKLKEEQQRNKELEAVNKIQAPKAAFTDAVIASNSSCLIGELAKILTQNGYQIGQNRLFSMLRETGYLGTRGEYYNMPNQQYVEQGLFEIKKSVHSENGVMKTASTPKVTGKGQVYFVNKFLGV